MTSSNVITRKNYVVSSAYRKSNLHDLSTWYIMSILTCLTFSGYGVWKKLYVMPQGRQLSMTTVIFV